MANSADIYALCDPATGEIRYIGKANDSQKRLKGHLLETRNGRNSAKKVHSDPRSRRIWELKQTLGDALRRGHLPESVKDKMRQAAIKAPHLFGNWANI